ncbi:hypothetical protein BC940DRAFT_314825 [Gongronella butleri]|nr:hypothetical protein BC940DRAFT_314825 [Gongronella butleri]
MYVSPPVSPEHGAQKKSMGAAAAAAAFDTTAQGGAAPYVFSGAMVLCSPQSRFGRQKKCYCVLTTRALLRFKTLDKATKAFPEMNKQGGRMRALSHPGGHDAGQKLLVSLDTVFAVHKVHVSPFQAAVRIDHLDAADHGKPSSSIILFPADGGDVKPWLHAIRSAIEPFLLGLVSVSSAEQFSALERFKKQNDASGSTSLIHKVLLKTKKTAQGQNDANAQAAALSSVEQKDIYVPVIVALGENSVYVLPSKTEHNDYRRYVKRDRYGLLAIQRMVLRDDDDTLIFDMSNVHGPKQQLVLVSSVGRLIVCSIQRAIQALVPHFPHPPFALVYHQENTKNQQTTLQRRPSHMSFTGNASSTSTTAAWHRALTQPWEPQPIDLGKQPLATISALMASVLMSYCAALNLDRRRFRYTLTQAPNGLPRFHLVVQPPNEINGNFSSYSRLELLAYFRTLRHITLFESISFKDIRLHPMATWAIGADDSWTQSESNMIGATMMLAKELHLLLLHNRALRALDLGGSNQQHAHQEAQTAQKPMTMTRVASNSSNLSLHRAPTMATTYQAHWHGDAADTQASSNQQGCAPCAMQAMFLALCQGASDLTTFRFDGYTWHDQDVDRLVQLLSPIGHAAPFTALQHLSLRKSNLSTVAMETILHALAHGPAAQTLVHLDLQENPGFVSAGVFHDVWRQLFRLKHLGLPCAFAASDELRLLQPNKLLNVLDLSGSQLEDTHIHELAAWLTFHANSLRPPTKTVFDLQLCLARCGLHGQHVHYLCQAMAVQHHRRLRFHLTLDDNPLAKNVQHQPWLWSSITRHGPHALSLQSTAWDTNALRELLDALRQNTSVHSIDLSFLKMDIKDASVKDASMAPTSDASPRSPSIHPLQHQHPTPINASSSNASHMLAESLDAIDPTLPTALASLLGTKDDLVAFAMNHAPRHDLYSAQPKSSKLTIQETKPTMVGLLLSATFYRLAHNASMASMTLTSLAIEHHGLGDACIEAMCTWAKTCPSLQTLHVDGNQMTIVGFRALLDLAQKHGQLHVLPRPELDFRRELQRLEAQAWHLQESEAEMQYLVIHMVGVDSKRARALIEEQATAREAITVDLAQLPLVADQLHKQITDNADRILRQSKYAQMKPFWPGASGAGAVPSRASSSTLVSVPSSPPPPSMPPTMTPRRRTTSILSTSTLDTAPLMPLTPRSVDSRPPSSYSIFDSPLPPPTCPLPPIPTQWT